MAKISVILPTYNRAHTLERSIISVLSQSYTDLELIVVDDASTDKTQDLIKTFNDPRIIYLRHKGNMGANTARNTGIKKANGEYIAFQDSDDEWEREKLELQCNILKANSNIGVVYSGYILYKKGRSQFMPIPQRHPMEGDIFKTLIYGNFITTQTIMVRTDMLRAIDSFDESLPRLQDWDLMLRLSKITKVGFINVPLVKVYYSENSITSNPQKFIQAMLYLLSKYAEDFEKYPDATAEHYYNIGRAFLQIGLKKVAFKYFWEAQKKAPQLKYVTALSLCIAGGKVFNMVRNIYKFLMGHVLD